MLGKFLGWRFSDRRRGTWATATIIPPTSRSSIWRFTNSKNGRRHKPAGRHYRSCSRLAGRSLEIFKWTRAGLLNSVLDLLNFVWEQQRSKWQWRLNDAKKYVVVVTRVRVWKKKKPQLMRIEEAMLIWNWRQDIIFIL